MRSGTTGRGKGKRVRALTATAMLGAALAACGGESSGDALTWYINPDVGGQEEIAARCSEQSGGRYTIEASILPEDATLQREQLIRRLAGEDASVDLMSLDPPFQAEFAAAGFLYDIPDEQEKQLTKGVVKSAIKSDTWYGVIVTFHF